MSVVDDSATCHMVVLEHRHDGAQLNRCICVRLGPHEQQFRCGFSRQLQAEGGIRPRCVGKPAVLLGIRAAQAMDDRFPVAVVRCDTHEGSGGFYEGPEVLFVNPACCHARLSDAQDAKGLKPGADRANARLRG